MSHLSHPIKAEKLAILNFADSRQTEVHKQGCGHAAKAEHVSNVEPGDEPHAGDGYNDDWYKVAPCARKGA